MTRTKATCSIDGCERPARSGKTEFCNMHHIRWQRHGDPLFTLRIKGDLEARIESKIDRATAAPCHKWLGKPNRRNYGTIQHDGRPFLIHVFLWRRKNGPIPLGMTLDHVCHNEADPPCLLGDDCPHRLCVNLDHLVVKSNRDNVLAGNGPTAVNARKTHCVHGHEFTGANTIITGNGYRRCRACKNRSASERYFRKKAARSTGRAGH